MKQIVDLERRIEVALSEIERSVSLYSKNSSVDSDPTNEELEKLLLENEKLEAAIEELKAEHNTQLQSLIAEREEERETVKKLYKRLTEVACQEGEENFLTDAANLLNSESQKLVSQLGRLSESRMLLMAGLMLADRMINLEKSIHEREKQIEQKEIDIEKSISAAKAVSDSKPAFANEISDLLAKTATRLESVAKLTSGQ